ncbi:MAG: ATP-binding protein [Acidimicrobiia bacterium]|nr:ATP-binding protein [Acidimicrobiia bacterium]MDH5503271.1 ATP-binding protein [Acidimicrobiia bacterium]
MSVGRVVGTEKTSTQVFRVVLDEAEYLQLDDLVVVRTQVPQAGEIATYGIVTESEAVYEGASYESDTFRIAEHGILPAQKVRSAQIQVTRVDPEVWVSPDPGELVERASGEARDKALYADEMGRPLPVGIGRDNQPLYVDLDFFDGRKGGHMSISGISGVATKTSFALFFLRMLTGRRDIVGESGVNMRVLVFNVKGEDLLWLDKPNALFDDEARQKWEALGVEPTPFPSVAFWAPPRRKSGDVLLPDVAGRQEGVQPFAWTPREFIDEGLLRFLFTDAGDSRNQLSFVEERVRSQLQRWAVDIVGRPGAVVIRQPPIGGWKRGAEVKLEPGERVIEDLPSLVAALEEYLDPPDGEEPDRAWSGRVQGGTVSAFMRRLYAAQSRLGELIRAGDSNRIDRGKAQVTVVAIQSLHDLAQRFVVGALLQETFAEKEQTGQRLPLSVVVLDELNKYAPREGNSPLKDMLIDIAQRGRSLGVLLVGAQQTASRIAQEVMENAAIRVAGRLDAAEAERSEYGWMLPSTRARARLLKPGTMVISQPAIPVPLVVNFPFPPWATRREEVSEDVDPFSGL